jgi:hypothetical protein
MKTRRQMLREVANRRCDAEARTRRADYLLGLATLTAMAADARRPRATEVRLPQALASVPIHTEATSVDAGSAGVCEIASEVQTVERDSRDDARAPPRGTT